MPCLTGSCEVGEGSQANTSIDEEGLLEEVRDTPAVFGRVLLNISAHVSQGLGFPILHLPGGNI